MERLGIIGGSGVYQIDGLDGAEWVNVDTPWGAPSDLILTGRLAGQDMAFLPRHGRGHVWSPDTVPYRANIDALKRLGVRRLVSVSACGSFREDLPPGHFVLVDQFIDRTKGRPNSFFGPGCVAHVSMADPTCDCLRADLAKAARGAGISFTEGGTYVAMEGPQFSSKAESRMYRDVLGADVIGMTNMPEARLAREAELCYATVAMVTDFDSWHPDHGAVDITQIIETLGANTAAAAALVTGLAGQSGPAAPCPSGCNTALDHAIMTAPDKRDPAVLARLDAVAGRIL